MSLSLGHRLAPTQPFDVEFDDAAKTLIHTPPAHRRGRGELSQVLHLLELEAQPAAETNRPHSSRAGTAPGKRRAVTERARAFVAPQPCAPANDALANGRGATADLRRAAAPLPSLQPAPAPISAPQRELPPLAKAARPRGPAAAAKSKRQPTQVILRGHAAFELLLIVCFSAAVSFAATHVAGVLHVTSMLELLVPFVTAAAVANWFLLGLFGRVSALAPVVCAGGTAALIKLGVPLALSTAGAAVAVVGILVAILALRQRPRQCAL